MYLSTEKEKNSCSIQLTGESEKELQKLSENHKVWLILCFNPLHVRIFSEP